MAPDHLTCDPDSIDPARLERPLLVWDGTCGFCRRSVELLRDEVGDVLDVVAYQAIHDRIARVDEAEFARAVHLFEPDGRLYKGAEAIFRALDHGPGEGWLLKLTVFVPGFRAVAERGYAWVAAHRGLVDKTSRVLVGQDLRRSEFRMGRWLMLRMLGVVAAIAFASFLWQYAGLVGEAGILPVADFLETIHRQRVATGDWSALEAAWRAPTLFWIDAGDGTIAGVTIAGIAASVGLACGVWPRAMLVVIVTAYLSISTAGRVFYGFQWDSLLVEAAFVALLIAPRTFVDRARCAASWLHAWLVVWVLWRLHFMSGVGKLISGDEAWLAAHALEYHFWTQPLPTWTAYWAHQLPAWLLRGATAATLVAEVVLPILLLGPRRLRHAAVAGLIGLQTTILLTGNFAFFNYLTIGLCLIAIDDRAWRRLFKYLPARHFQAERLGAHRWRFGWPRRALMTAVAIVTTVGGLRMIDGLGGPKLTPNWVDQIATSTRFSNNYGLFRVMTQRRQELIIEASDDGRRWRELDFRWKPDREDERPRFIAPHQPRLDWQMWFAALSSCRQNPWLMALQRRLLDGSTEVTKLLEPNAGGLPARSTRVVAYEYRFSTPEQLAKTGHWWRREADSKRLYCPPVTVTAGALQLTAPARESKR